MKTHKKMEILQALKAGKFNTETLLATIQTQVTKNDLNADLRTIKTAIKIANSL